MSKVSFTHIYMLNSVCTSKKSKSRLGPHVCLLGLSNSIYQLTSNLPHQWQVQQQLSPSSYFFLNPIWQALLQIDSGIPSSESNLNWISEKKNMEIEWTCYSRRQFQLNFSKMHLFFYSSFQCKKRFIFDEMFQWKASKFVIFMEYENTCSLFPFFLSCYFTFFT